MQFHEHETLYDYERETVVRAHYKNCDEYYRGEIALCNKGEMLTDGREKFLQQVRRRLLWCESAWYKARRPYYKVFPAIGRALTRIDLNLRLSDYCLPKNRVLCVRMPTLEHKYGGIETVLLVHLDGAIVIVPQVRDGNNFFSHTPLSLTNDDDKTIAGKLEMVKYVKAPRYDDAASLHQELLAACKIAISVLLLANDPSIIEPEVLAADREKFAATGDMKYVEKAKRRGVVGWTIGREFETCPHWRRPHLAMRHTGKGRSVPRIVPIKGTIVHRSKLAKVPTGHFSEDGVEVE